MNGQRVNLNLCAMGVMVWFAAAPAGAADGPKIACGAPECRFGAMANSETLEHTFVIDNEGNAPLQIGNIRGCCGATITMTDKTILPGSNAVLKVRLSLAGRQGEMRKSIYVGSNDPTQPYYQLRFMGNVTTPVMVEPPGLDFGMIDEQTATSASVRVVSASSLPLRITNIVSTTALLAAGMDPEQRASPWSIRIRTVPPLPMGMTRGAVTILTDHPKYAKVDVPVIFAVVSDLVMVPSEITFAEGKEKSAPTTYHVAIRSRTNKPFNITNTQAPESDIKVDIEALKSGGYRITLNSVLPFDDLNGKDLVITTDHEQVKRVAIPFKMSKDGGN